MGEDFPSRFHIAIRDNRPLMVVSGPLPDGAVEYVRADIANDLAAACEAYVYGREADRKCEAMMKAALARAKGVSNG